MYKTMMASIFMLASTLSLTASNDVSPESVSRPSTLTETSQRSVKKEAEKAGSNIAKEAKKIGHKAKEVGEDIVEGAKEVGHKAKKAGENAVEKVKKNACANKAA